MDRKPDPDGDERDETPTERADRNWDELLQELRVTQTGIQILSGFLLTLVSAGAMAARHRLPQCHPPWRSRGSTSRP